MQKYRTYFTGKLTLHVAQTLNTEQLQHCMPQKHGLFGYVIVNTVHKGGGDDEDGDDDDDDYDDDDKDSLTQRQGNSLVITTV